MKCVADRIEPAGACVPAAWRPPGHRDLAGLAGVARPSSSRRAWRGGRGLLWPL